MGEALWALLTAPFVLAVIAIIIGATVIVAIIDNQKK